MEPESFRFILIGQYTVNVYCILLFTCYCNPIWTRNITFVRSHTRKLNDRYRCCSCPRWEFPFKRLFELFRLEVFGILFTVYQKHTEFYLFAIVVSTIFPEQDSQQPTTYFQVYWRNQKNQQGRPNGEHHPWRKNIPVIYRR